MSDARTEACLEAPSCTDTRFDVWTLHAQCLGRQLRLEDAAALLTHFCNHGVHVGAYLREAR